MITELDEVKGESALDDFNVLTPLPPPVTIGLEPEEDDDSGVRIGRVSGGSVAEAAGIRSGDLLLAVDRTPISTVDELRSIRVEWGKTIPVVLERQGERLEATLRIPERPEMGRQQAFVRGKPSGRVELVRQDNRIVVHTRGVRRFQLLLSPDQFDFSRPITVITNGATSFDGPVRLDTATLLRWAREDQDRTMLFGAELDIEVGSSP